MVYTVDLALDVEKALAKLSDDDHQQVMELIAAALVEPNSCPTPGGWGWALRLGPRLWIVFTACLDGIDVVSLGANEDLAPAA
ncbi:hypothetical protein [Streptomyces bauhiniae]|uniref:hypothetical protein n=1 Tax=Streptomyces bauhiniae TaxID=2340725 RepID=UPI00364D658B